MAFDTLKNGLHRILAGLMLLLSCGATFAQQHDFLFHPSFRDEYLTTHVLPDGGLRVFFIADQNNGWTFREVQYKDIYPDSASTAPPITISTPEGYINYFVDHAFVVRLHDGSAIIADFFFDCDYGHAGSIYKLNASGAIDWWHYLVDDFQVYEIINMGFVDEDLLGIHNGGSIFLMDLQGNPVGSSISHRVPDLSMQTQFGYLVSYSDSLEILDTSFQRIQWYLLEGDILSMDLFDDGGYRIKTTEKYYELDSAFQLTYLPIEGAVVWSSPASYWQYAQLDHRVIQYDTFFVAMDTLALPPGIHPVTGASLDGHVMTLSEYANEKGQGLVLFDDPENNVHFELPQDLGITDLVFPDSVLAEYFNSTVPWSGWSYTYEWVDAQVTNFGPGPVSFFYIQGDALLDCFWWCYAPVPFWQIDSLLLLPGDQAWVRLPGFTTRCDWQGFDPSLCLSTVAPNERADGLHLNDAWCESFDIVLQDEEPEMPAEISVFPNPASDAVFVMADIPPSGQLRLELIHANGVTVTSVQVVDEKTTIPLDDIMSGIYFLKTTHPNGWSHVTKLVVVR